MQLITKMPVYQHHNMKQTIYTPTCLTTLMPLCINKALKSYTTQLKLVAFLLFLQPFTFYFRFTVIIPFGKKQSSFATRDYYLL